MNTESDNRFISYKGMKRILRSNLNGNVSKETIEFLQLYFEELIKQQLRVICGNVLVRQEEANRLREFHGLPEHKRFSLSVFLNGVDEILKPSTDLMVEGEQAKLVFTCLSQKAKRR